MKPVLILAAIVMAIPVVVAADLHDAGEMPLWGLTFRETGMSRYASVFRGQAL